MYCNIENMLMECHLKSSKPHPERTVEGFCCHSTLSLINKTRKTNSDFCLNFCAGEAHTQMRGVATNLNSGWGLELFKQSLYDCSQTFRSDYIFGIR